jgi:hypothetical protein
MHARETVYLPYALFALLCFSLFTFVGLGSSQCDLFAKLMFSSKAYDES